MTATIICGIAIALLLVSLLCLVYRAFTRSLNPSADNRFDAAERTLFTLIFIGLSVGLAFADYWLGSPLQKIVHILPRTVPDWIAFLSALISAVFGILLLGLGIRSGFGILTGVAAQSSGGQAAYSSTTIPRRLSLNAHAVVPGQSRPILIQASISPPLALSSSTQPAVRQSNQRTLWILLFVGLIGGMILIQNAVSLFDH